MDIGPLTRAMDAAGGGRAVGDLPRDARLRDLAGPDAERLPRTIARNVPKAMGSAGEMAGALEDMMPQLRETARKLKAFIYSAGNLRDPGEAYRAFRGRLPTPEALLVKRGLVPAAA